MIEENFAFRLELEKTWVNKQETVNGIVSRAKISIESFNVRDRTRGNETNIFE